MFSRRIPGRSALPLRLLKNVRSKELNTHYDYGKSEVFTEKESNSHWLIESLSIASGKDNIIKVYASFTFNDDTELHQYRIPMIMKGAQTQRLMQVIDIGIIPLAGNLLERNLASLIDRVYQS